MDEETRTLIREALELYKRELTLMEAQTGVLESNNKRLTSWKARMVYVAAFILMGVTMGVLFPLMDHVLNH
jgi:hypothetical protein